ncbi:unnamed protein product, partial [Mesorhabditis belari]|uniref:Uncharacterized protein n=1 Tax=Mesorhabditis belari TaxID=2138241 RepID=A0AAF3E8Q7_9BILA
MDSHFSPDPTNDPMLQQLFRIFSFFADLCPSGTLSPPQAHFILAELQKACELPTTSRDFVFDSDCITFRELLTYIEALFLDRDELEAAVQRLFEQLISQIIRKDFVLYRRRRNGCSPFSQRSQWKAAWITIVPGTLNLRPVHKPNEKETLTLEKTTIVLVGPKEDEHYLLYVDSGKKHYALAHMDNISRNSLVKDIKMGITFRTRVELSEHHRRIAQRSFGVHGKNRELSWRLALEAENARLLQIIEEGKRSLRDEEIVRSLAARMLEEERGKNEQLTQLLAHFERQLRLSNQPENTTITINLERIEEEENDEVQVIERDEEGGNLRDSHFTDTDSTATASHFESEVERTPYDEANEISAVERARRERELYLITSTQSI